MYYKEAWINGKLCYKSTPEGEWIPFTIGQYKQRVLELEEKVKNLALPQVSKCEGIEREALLLAYAKWRDEIVVHRRLKPEELVKEFLSKQ